MKIHEGFCNNLRGPYCERTHAYKCRLCTVWFKQDPIQIGDNTRTGWYPHEFYPYCSLKCAKQAEIHDKGFHMFAARLNTEDRATDYKSSEDHYDFNFLIQQTKEL